MDNEPPFSTPRYQRSSMQGVEVGHVHHLSLSQLLIVVYHSRSRSFWVVPTMDNGLMRIQPGETPLTITPL